MSENPFIHNSNVHGYNTQDKNDLQLLKSSTSKGLLRSNCSFITDWNILDEDIRQLSCLSSFEHAVLSFFRYL